MVMVARVCDSTKLIELYVEMSELFGMWIIPPERAGLVVGGLCWGAQCGAC